MPEKEDEGKDDGTVIETDDERGGGDKDLETIININDFKEDEDGEEKEKGKAKEKKEADEDGEKGKDGEKDKNKEKPKADPKDTTIADLIKKNKDLNVALHNARQERKKGGGKKDDEVVLTDAQIEGLLVEYKDDPKTLLNVIKYQATQAAKGAAKKTVDDADVGRKKKETEDYLYKTFPDLTKDDSELRASVEKVKGEFGIEDHPYGEFFGTAVTALMSMPTLIKQAYDKGRKDMEDGVKEKTRKDLIKDGDLTPKGKSKGAGDHKELTADESDVAKRLGLTNPKQVALFKKLRSGAKGSRTVSVEE